MADDMHTANPATPATVDIVILSWDRLQDTLEAIQSALDQGNVQKHIFVIDQGSKPEVVSALKAFCRDKPEITPIFNAKNLGVPGGRAQGSRLGSGAFLVSLDNDAVFASPFELETAAIFMQTRPEIGVLAFKILRYADSEIDQTSWAYHQKSDIWGDQFFETSRFVGAGHMISRSAYEAAGGYDDRIFFLHEEVDLSYRMIGIGKKIFYNPTVTIRHKVSPEHRVSWSEGRFYYDVRNKIYLASKFNFSLPAALLESLFLVLSGFRNGMGKAALRGFIDGLALIPRATWMKMSDPRLRLSRDVKQRLKVLSAVDGISAFRRLNRRLKNVFANSDPHRRAASR